MLIKNEKRNYWPLRAHKLVHKNTLKAFQKALDLGVDGIEPGVQKIIDGRLVIFHDEQIAGKKISQLSLEEINGEALKLNYHPLLFYPVGGEL